MSVVDVLSQKLVQETWRVRARDRLLFRLRDFLAGLKAQRVPVRVAQPDSDTLVITVDLRAPEPFETPVLFRSQRSGEG